MPAFLGVDVGTSGARALVVDADGRKLGAGATSYGLAMPAPGQFEQDAEDWVRGAAGAVRAALADARTTTGRAGSPGFAASDVAGLALTGQMHSVVFLDARDRVLRPAILWCDQRTVAECEEITRRAGGRSGLLGLTLNRALPGFTAPKILWLKHHEPQLFAQVRSLLVAKDYVRWRWTGERATEVSDASGTLLLDVARRSWSRPLLEMLELDAGWLPRCVESTEIVGRLTAAAAGELGLPVGLPVVAGGGDQATSAVGSGVVRPGTVSISLGTSGVVFAACEQPLVDPEGSLHSFCHAVPGLWHAMGVMLSAGGAVSWFRKLVSGGSAPAPYSVLDAEAAAVAPGSEGLLFLPYLAGERPPIDDPHARGAFFGFALQHGRGHAMRAVMEGVAYGLASSFALLAAHGLPCREVRLTGGGARSAVFAGIVASVLGRELLLLEQDEGPAFGAALLAAVGLQAAASVPAAADQWVRVRSRVAPDAAAHALHQEKALLHRRLYEALRPLEEAL